MSLSYHEEQLRIRQQKQPKEKRIPLRTQLLEILDELPTLISAAGQGFALIPCPGGRNAYNLALQSPALQDWLLARAINRNLPLPSLSQIRDAIRGFRARCHTTSLARKTMHIRTAWNPALKTQSPDNTAVSFRPAMVYALDARAGTHAVITEEGWSIESSPTPFIYAQVQQPLPQPNPEPDPEAAPALPAFRKLLRLHDSQHDAAWQSLLSWILTAMRPARNTTFHDYPILNLTGPARSGKSVTARILTHLLDPTGTPIHSLPSTERRLHGLAATHHVLTFDDPGKINPEKSRNLSHLSSGVASVHSALDGTLCRPIILATSEVKQTKHLANRVVDIELPAVDHPLSAEEIGQQFEALRPQLLAELLTLLSRNFDQPPSLLPNRKTKNQKIDESVPQILKNNGGSWKGTMNELAANLSALLKTKVSAIALSRALDAMPAIHTLKRKSGDTRPVTLTLETAPVGSALPGCEPDFHPAQATPSPVAPVLVSADSRVPKSPTPTSALHGIPDNKRFHA